MDSNVDMGASSSNPRHARPLLCLAGCGFHGTAENGGLCSKCYTSGLIESIAITQETTSLQDLNIDDNPKENEIASAAALAPLMAANPAAKSRCSVCRKKVALYGFDCRCGLRLCGSHRYPDEHGCGFDYKGVGKKAIEKQNPRCIGDKLPHRI